MNAQELVEYVKKHSGDANYQDIEIDGKIIHKGYTPSQDDWKLIKEIVTVKGKSVCDVGCFNGYFSFKAEDAGAVFVDGYDTNAAALDIANKIKTMRKSGCNFIDKNIENDVPFLRRRYEIAFVLNVIHHVTDVELQKRFILELFKKCEEVVVEANAKEFKVIEECAKDVKFEMKKARKSTRADSGGEYRYIKVYGKIFGMKKI